MMYVGRCNRCDERACTRRTRGHKDIGDQAAMPLGDYDGGDTSERTKVSRCLGLNSTAVLTAAVITLQFSEEPTGMVSHT
jgi:hypothetical protein